VGGVGDLAFSPDGRLLAAVVLDELDHRTPTVRFWDVAARRPVDHRHVVHVPPSRGSPDGKLLATTSSDGERGAVQLRNPSTGRRVGPMLGGLSQFVDNLAFDPTGALLAVSDSTDIRLWAVAGR
jgi:WD40 repeat protein